MANQAKRLIMSRLTVAARCYSTSTATALNKGKAESLFRWLSALGGGSDAGVADAVDQWVKQGNSVNRLDVISCVTQLRKFRRYRHALQLYNWMEKGVDKMNNADRAICIDLLAKAEGGDSAEKYFNSLEGSAKTTKTYGALLSCYCREKMLEKAGELFEKMKELGCTSALNYNNMMSLYLSIGQPEKVPLLAKEMEEMNIAADRYNYNQLLNAYAALKDYDALEGVLETMKTKKVMPGWFTYGNLATIYVNAGLTDKAYAALKKLKKKKNVQDCEAYHSLITLYGRTSYLPGIYQSWKVLKLNFPKPTNTSYLVLLLALLKLDDVNGLKKYFAEWESGCSTYDVRLANVILESYLNRNMIKEAIDLQEKVVSRGVEPNLKTMDLFMNFYLKKRQMDLALKFFEMGASKVRSERSNWYPSVETVGMFVKFFGEEKDEDGAEKFCELMKKLGRLDSDGDISVLRTCIAA